MSSPSITESQILTVLGDFLTSVCPAGTPIVVAQQNRVPELAQPTFLTMTPRSRTRLSTNSVSLTDIAFSGSIAGATLTVSALIAGAPAIGQILYGAGVAVGTQIVAGSGVTWTVSPAQTVASTTIQAGTAAYGQPTEFTAQIDVHGPGCGDIAETVATLFRSPYACDFMAGSGYAIQPLYASDPAQLPFINGEQQYEERYTIDLRMQADIINPVAQQYLDQLSTDLINVDAAYPV